MVIFIISGGVLCFLGACTSKLTVDDLPEFTYVDSLKTVKKVNCAKSDPLHCMACALQGEAANQSARGMYAVGVTIMTRAKGNIHNICRVTKARRQFEGMKRKGWKKISKKVWKVANHIMESKEIGWTHFWAPRTQARLKRRKPAWAYKFDKRQCLKEKIDDHIFYNTNLCKFDPYMKVSQID